MHDFISHLKNLLKNISLYSGILSLQFISITRNPNTRQEVLKKIVSKKKTFHFAIENQIVSSSADIDKINDYWAVKKTLVENNL